MIREQIIEKAKNYQGDKLSFVDGAEWMQAQLSEKLLESFCIEHCGHPSDHCECIHRVNLINSVKDESKKFNS